MSFIKFNKDRFPWTSNGMINWLDTDGIIGNDFFTKMSTLPAMNVKGNKKDYELEPAVPGFLKKDIAITMDNDVLCISGKNESKTKQEEEEYTRKDFNYASFERNIQLPQEVDPEKNVTANYNDGILTLELHKKQDALQQPKRTIAIR